MWVLAGILLLSIVQGSLLTSLAMRLARQFRFLDWPDKQRKLHGRATPLLGGLAVCSGLLLGVAECHLLGIGWLADGGRTTQFTSALLLSTAALCAIGLVDDKWGMRARNKFLLQIVAIAPFAWYCNMLSNVSVFGWQIDAGGLGVPLTLFWLVACTNFVNLIDGLDGLAGSVSLVVALTVAGLSFLNQQAGIPQLAIILAGVLIGFLIHNAPPARIFLGDSGSLPLGFLVGALAIEASAKKAAGLTLAVPFVLLSIPMFDTAMAILRRKLNGQGIGDGDRAHIHHCLRDRGLTPRQTLLAIAGMSLTNAVGVVAAALYDSELIAVGVCGSVLSLLVLGRLFGFNEVILLSRHVQAVWDLLTRIPRTLQTRFVLVRLNPAKLTATQELWDRIVHQLEEMRGARVECVLQNLVEGRPVAHLVWNSEQPAARGVHEWQLKYSVPRGSELLVTMSAQGTLRRIDQHHHLDELLEMLSAFCTNCPLTGFESIGNARPDGPTLPIPEPHMIAGRVRQPEREAA
jgi:UDP-GlcNAc:undecaprenyl-phosphate GlcNAc-1-phosphate transferase